MIVDAGRGTGIGIGTNLLLLNACARSAVHLGKIKLDILLPAKHDYIYYEECVTNLRPDKS